MKGCLSTHLSATIAFLQREVAAAQEPAAPVEPVPVVVKVPVQEPAQEPGVVGEPVAGKVQEPVPVVKGLVTVQAAAKVQVVVAERVAGKVQGPAVVGGPVPAVMVPALAKGTASGARASAMGPEMEPAKVVIATDQVMEPGKAVVPTETNLGCLLHNAGTTKREIPAANHSLCLLVFLKV